MGTAAEVELPPQASRPPGGDKDPLPAAGTAATTGPAGSEALNITKTSSAQHVAAYRQHDAPDEVIAVSDESEYKEYRKLTDLREPYHIPADYLVGTKKFVGLRHAETPLIVFINAKSGGRVGTRLATVLFHALGQGQVFDLADNRPYDVLKRLFENLSEREAAGDMRAAHIRRNLRIVAAGGDGTVTWLLKTLDDLGLDPLPAVGVVPLGTGNDLSLSFGWGNLFLRKWIWADKLYKTLKRFADAEVGLLDAWRLTIDAPSAQLFHELPHCLQLNKDAGSRQVSGCFWNYFSVGLDAEAAHSFHRLRESTPWAASTRMANQAWYSFFACTSGWFCGAPPLVNKMRLRVKDKKGDAEWRDVELPKSVRALVLLNLQSYGGGRDIWGLSDNSQMKERGFKEPIFDDGLIEVVGLGSGWHTMLVMGQVTSSLHAVRLAQCAEVCMELAAGGGKKRGVKGETSVTHMQVDGEPWQQEIPAAGEGQQPLRVHVACEFQSRMLFNSADIQGGMRVKRLAKRGADKKATVAALPVGADGGSSAAGSPGNDGSTKAGDAAAVGAEASEEGRSAPRSTLTEHGSTLNGTARADEL